MEAKELRGPKLPDKTTLIGQQKDSYEELLEFMKGGTQMFCLEGFAGVGKSYIINMFVEQMICEYGSNICVCAPTHKAVFVLRNMAQFKSDWLTYSTIHSLLGLKPVVTSHGNESFVRDRSTKNKVQDYDILIIDESSMLDDQLFIYIMEELEQNPELKVIFVGDGKQLPPVNHASSIPMDAERREGYGIDHTQLTEIIRQKEGNPIIELSKEIREGVFKPKKSINEDGDGIYIVGRKNYRKVLESFFACDKYENNPDYCRATAWRNNTVNHYNTMIRDMIYKYRIKARMKELEQTIDNKEDLVTQLKSEFPFYRGGKTKLPKFVTGDKLIVDKPIFDVDCPSTICFHTNEELLMGEYTIENRMGHGEVYKCYIAEVKNIYTGRVEFIEIIHEDDEEKFEAAKEKLRKEALQEKKGSAAARNKWITYYDLDKRFARLKYAPCLTTYKSQGSTYENIIIFAQDIRSCPKKREMFQHLYVAVTRASKKVIIFI